MLSAPEVRARVGPEMDCDRHDADGKHVLRRRSECGSTRCGDRRAPGKVLPNNAAERMAMALYRVLCILCPVTLPVPDKESAQRDLRQATTSMMRIQVVLAYDFGVCLLTSFAF